MATDDALLEWTRLQPNPVWIIRTYQWEVPTLSYGVHQSDISRAHSFNLYQQSDDLTAQQKPQAWVQRPTGGRAILHGEDISFSVTTNDSYGVGQTLTESYSRITDILEGALSKLHITHNTSPETKGSAYTQSALCFETHTPHDIVGEDGHKMAGCAQVRRQNGVLQHGAVFFKHPVSEANFLTALNDSFIDISIGQRKTIIANQHNAKDTLLIQSDYREISAPIMANYEKSLSGKVASAATT